MEILQNSDTILPVNLQQVGGIRPIADQVVANMVALPGHTTDPLTSLHRSLNLGMVGCGRHPFPKSVITTLRLGYQATMPRPGALNMKSTMQVK